MSFVLPARELAREEDDGLKVVLATALQTLKENGLNAELVIHGRSYRSKASRKLSYANLSWFLEAKRGRYFRYGSPYELTDVDIRYDSCNCEACKGRSPKDLAGMENRVEALALHNLLDLNWALGGI